MSGLRVRSSSYKHIFSFCGDCYDANRMTKLFMTHANGNCDVNAIACVLQAYHDVWIGLLLATHLRMVMVNTTTYESIKGRRWVDNSTHGKPFYVRYPMNCFRFFFRPGGESGRMAGPYGRVPNQVPALNATLCTIRREPFTVVVVRLCTGFSGVHSPLREGKERASNAFSAFLPKKNLVPVVD